IYAPLAGGAPSAWRAAITAAIAWSLRASGRKPDAVAVTAASVIVFGIADPETLVKPGFLLSIAATAAILAPIEGAFDKPLRAIVVASVRASVATAPVVLWCFEGVPIAGVLANVVVVPIASAVLLPIAAVHALLASTLPSLAGPSAALIDLISRAFLASCEAFAAIPIGRGLPPLDIAQGVAVACTCTALLLVRGVREKAIVLAIGALAIGAAELRLRHVEQPRGEVRATFLDVGQGDGALIDMPDGRLVLVDAGGVVGGGLDPGAVAIVPLLRARRRARIDLAVITHPHPDHYGGLRALLEHVEVGEIWDTGQAEDESPDGEFAEMLRSARARGVVVRTPADLCGSPRAFGEATLRVLWPCPVFDAGWDPNDNSFVIELAIGARRMLLSGDAEHHEESVLAASGLLGHVDVLKVAHHGSRTSSTPPFLEALTPRVAIVSAGRANRFGHPHPDVVERLAATAQHVVRTDREGGAIVTTDGRRMHVQTWRGRVIDVE
ncbi:MAG: ComEC/Rec2 family competence protein, partial [Myxococcota bacterium]|nr:ComEC/Rec2 family competence protein [Myxococcota bacterium]